MLTFSLLQKHRSAATDQNCEKKALEQTWDNHTNTLPEENVMTSREILAIQRECHRAPDPLLQLLSSTTSLQCDHHTTIENLKPWPHNSPNSAVYKEDESDQMSQATAPTNLPCVLSISDCKKRKALLARQPTKWWEARHIIISWHFQPWLAL